MKENIFPASFANLLSVAVLLLGRRETSIFYSSLNDSSKLYRGFLGNLGCFSVTEACWESVQHCTTTQYRPVLVVAVLRIGQMQTTLDLMSRLASHDQLQQRSLQFWQLWYDEVQYVATIITHVHTFVFDR